MELENTTLHGPWGESALCVDAYLTAPDPKTATTEMATLAVDQFIKYI